MNALPGYHHRQKPRFGARLDLDTELAQGLQFASLLTEGAGATAFDLLTGAKGAFSTPSPSWTAGRTGNALSFSTTSQQVNWTGEYGLAGQKQVTAAVWAKSATAAQTVAGLFTQGGFSASGPFAFKTTSGGAMRWVVNGTAVTDPTNIDAKWHLWVGTYDGVTTRLYRDAVQVASSGLTGALGTSTGTSLGNVSGSGGLWAVESAFFWNRALTPGEVASLSADPYPMVAPPALWRLAAVQAAGGVTLNATGSPTAQAATVSGAASVPLNAAGSASAQAATVLGAASVPLNAAGAVSAGSAVSTGAASVPLNAGGSVSSQVATAAGAGTVSLPGINADGAVTPGAAASAGLASIPLSALGFLTARPATAAGAVSIPVNAAGAVFALSASAAGAGTIVQGPTVRRYYFVRAGRVYFVKNSI